MEEKATVTLEAGVPVDVLVEYTNTTAPDGADENGEGRNAQPALMRGVVCRYLELSTEANLTPAPWRMREDRSRGRNR